MSFSTVKVQGAKEDLVVSIPSTDDPAGSAGTTADTDLTGDAGGTTPNKLYWIEVDCRNNPGEDGTLQLYSKANGSLPLAIGTDHSHVWVPGKRGRKTAYHFPMGIPWTSNMHARYIKGPGGTGGSDEPSGQVKVRLGVKVGTT